MTKFRLFVLVVSLTLIVLIGTRVISLPDEIAKNKDAIFALGIILAIPMGLVITFWLNSGGLKTTITRIVVVIIVLLVFINAMLQIFTGH